MRTSNEQVFNNPEDLVNSSNRIIEEKSIIITEKLHRRHAEVHTTKLLIDKDILQEGIEKPLT